MPQLRPTVLVLAFAAALAACTSTAPQRFEADPTVDLRSLQRFAWHPTPREPATPLDSEILRKRVRAAATEHLAGRGYVQDDAAPQFRLRAHLVVEAGAKPAPRVSIGLGAGSFGGRSGSSVSVGGSTAVGKAGDALTLVIEIRDARTDELIWQGWREVNKSISDPQKPALAEAVRQILRDFPVPAEKRRKQR